MPVNIQENKHYPGIEFVVLDYNSKDGMEDWAKTTMREFIESGVLKYYRTIEPEYFRAAHSRNMAAKLATGDILCMVDADNFAGEDYAGYVNSVFEKQGDRTIITTLREDSVPYRDQGGKICVRKEYFHEVNGYDEDFVFYGVEDMDLVNRLEHQGGKRLFIDDAKYLRFIGHSDVERVMNHSLINKLDSLYVMQTANMQTENTILYLFSDNTFAQVKYEYNPLKKGAVSSFGGWIVADNGPEKGTYRRVNNELQLTLKNGQKVNFQCGQGSISTLSGGKRQSWKRLNEPDEWYIKLVIAYGECINRVKGKKNELGNEPVNTLGWGKGMVYTNFDATRVFALA